MGSLYSTINPVSLLTDTETNTFSNTETNTFTKTRTNTRTNIHFLSWLKFDLIGLDKTKIGQYYKYREQKMLMKHNPGKRLFPLETMTNGVCQGTIETVPMVDRPQSLFSFLMAKLDWLRVSTIGHNHNHVKDYWWKPILLAIILAIGMMCKHICFINNRCLISRYALKKKIQRKYKFASHIDIKM